MIRAFLNEILWFYLSHTDVKQLAYRNCLKFLRYFSSTYEMCLINIETEAVLAKIKMNSECNVRFLQNTIMCSKSIVREVVFTKTEINNK